MRPTRSMVREAIFDILGPRIREARVLDLFSGSGLLGLEAISRGAQQVFFVEHDKQTCKILRSNIQTFVKAHACPIMCVQALHALKQLCRRLIRFDIVFMDPPYDMNVSPVLNRLASNAIVKPGGRIVLERSKHTMDTIPEFFTVIKEKTYGYTRIMFLQPVNPK